MVIRGIAKTAYHLYDIINGRVISNLYHHAREVNENNVAIPYKKIKGYLKRWNFHPEIEKNPLMTKADIINFSNRIELSRVKEWAYTGGSYGEPLKIPYSAYRCSVRTATFRYFNEKGGHHLGDPFVIIRAKKRSSLTKFLRNETIIIPQNLSESNIKEYFDILIKKRIKLLMGYPSVIYALALHLENNKDLKSKLKVKSIISVSEPLDLQRREVIYRNFNCSYVDRYSNEEVGMIAQQKEFGGDYYTNKFGIYTEIINPDTLLPVKEGEVGKVVVTDLNNDLIPVIRYDTGDLAIAKRYKDGQLLSISNIIGRETEQIFSTSGSPVSSLMLGPLIYKPLANVGAIFQYQFAQISANQYELRIRAKKGQLPSSVSDEIIRGLKEVLGNNVEITVQFVNYIKPQPSGKRPIYKNEMIK